jgi:hypothetical protein
MHSKARFCMMGPPKFDERIGSRVDLNQLAVSRLLEQGLLQMGEQVA